ncbi:2830_t:CDS:2, partial [Diversispora eburnea]
MSQEKEIVHCTAGHSSNNIIMSIKIDSGFCEFCDKEHLVESLELGWKYSYVDIKFDSRYDISGFLKE